MADTLKVVVVGLGNMGLSHARAYHALEDFEITGLVSRTIKDRTDLPDELAGYPRYSTLDDALAAGGVDAVSINTWPDTHAEYALRAFDAGAHVFMEKPIGTTVAEAEAVVAKARETNRKLVIGYILRVHPSWAKLVEIGQTLGKPLVMRMNLNQQSSGPAWTWHKNLMQSLTPIVDCGVHYVDVMCQLTGAKPVRVHGIGASLSDEVSVPNYGHLHVTFDDGSVGWYEAGWGPMMSEVAYFVKDVIGPKGCVNIVVRQDGTSEASGEKISDSADIDQHTKTNTLKVHYADIDGDNNFTRPDEWIDMADEPDHQQLCDREQEFFARAIREDVDLSDQMQAAVDSLRIVLAADQSIREKRAIDL